MLGKSTVITSQITIYPELVNNFKDKFASMRNMQAKAKYKQKKTKTKTIAVPKENIHKMAGTSKNR